MLGAIFRREKRTALDSEIDAVLNEMGTEGVTSDKYPKLLGYYKQLMEIKATERPELISRNTIVIVAGSFLTTLLVLGYEHAHPITSKAFSTINRPRPD